MYIKDRLRRSMMFVPGNNPGMIRDAHIYGADSIMFDLEDSVAYTEKDAARLLVYNALRSLNFGSRETVVRINDLSSGLGIEDLEAVVRAGVQVVRLPKTDSAQDVIDCEREIARIERESGIPVGTTGMMAAIESANGVLNAAEIARASNRLIGIARGAEDYVTDLKTTRSDGIELLFARCMILNAARAAGIAALDTVYSDVNNEEGFLAEAMLIKKLGFDGKSVINPRQIEPLHRVFMPSEKDLNKARLIMAAIEEANARGSGVASLKGKMIDKPVVTRARRLLDLYEAGSKIDAVEAICHAAPASNSASGRDRAPRRISRRGQARHRDVCRPLSPPEQGRPLAGGCHSPDGPARRHDHQLPPPFPQRRPSRQYGAR